MLQRPDPFEELARRVVPGSKLVRSWDLRGGVSAQVTALEIERGDGGTERVIVRRHGARELRRNPRLAADEFRLLQMLQSAGIPAPRPRYADPEAEILPTPCLVLDYVEGELGAGATEPAEVVTQLAAVLVDIHQVEAAGADVSFLPQRELGEPTVRAAAESAEDWRIRDLLQAALPLPERNRPVLLHGDFWPGNTVWRNGRLVAVIDWEDAAVGDPLADLANARLELLWALGVEAMEELTRRYVSVTGVDPTDLPYWDLWADLRLATRIGEWGLAEDVERAMRAQHEAFVAQALEKVPTR